MFDVGGYADDLAPSIGASVTDALADWIIVREMAARRRLADDDDFGRILVVTFVELAPGDEPHAHCAEIVIADRADPCHRSLIGLRRGTPFNYKPGVRIRTGERKR